MYVYLDLGFVCLGLGIFVGFVSFFHKYLIIHCWNLFLLGKCLQKSNKINIQLLSGKRLAHKTLLRVNLKPGIAIVTVLRFKNICDWPISVNNLPTNLLSNPVQKLHISLRLMFLCVVHYDFVWLFWMTLCSIEEEWSLAHFNVSRK